MVQAARRSRFPSTTSSHVNPAIHAPSPPVHVRSSAGRRVLASAVATQVLLVDDDEDMRDVLGELLGMVGMEPTTVASIDGARALLERTAFDLVISDLLMPAWTVDQSWSSLDALVQAAGPTPVGVLSGIEVVEHDAHEHGLAFALLKPVTGETLLEHAAKHLLCPPLSPAQEASLRRYFTCLEGSNWAGLDEICTADVVYHVPGSDPRFSRTVVGRAELRAIAAETFAAFREPRFELASIRTLPSAAIVRYHASWLGAGGQRHGIDGAVLFRMTGALISEIGVRTDLAALQRLHAAH
jgi:CheY-like chemotaxis protein